MSADEQAAAAAAVNGIPPSAEQARLIAEGLPHLAWLARADGAVVWYNQRWHEYTGISPAQVEQDGCLSAHEPSRLPKVLERWQYCIRAGRTFEMEVPLRGADGRYRMFLVRTVPVRDEAGAISHWVGTATDVSLYNEANVTLRLALDAAYLVAFIWDIPTNEVRRFYSTGEMFHISARGPRRIEDVKERVYPEDLAVFEANVDAALHDPRGTYRSEFRIYNADNQLRWLLDKGRVEFDSEGNPLRLIGLSQDITEQKESELRLTHAQVQLEAAVAERTARLQELVSELGTFSYSISHDLRAPLRSIHGFADLLREEAWDQLSESSRSHLDRVIRAAQRMDALIRDVLEYSRITRAELTIEDLDPTDVVREVIEGHDHLQPPKALIDIARPLPRVRASRPALLQCFANLLGNAVKFVAPGVVPAVRVGGEVADGVARIWVQDNGIGIPPQQKDRIWGMLERLNPSYEGTGVGLSIVRKAVERMGGRVGVESEPGKGSRFWIELPSPAS